MSAQPRVLLVSMPFVSCERPALGLSLLQAQLRRRKTHCDIRYLTFALVDSIGADAYSWVSSDLPYTAFVGDWLFARSTEPTRPRTAPTSVRSSSANGR